MAKSKSFSELIVWQKAHRLVLEVYKSTKYFPKEEMYGLTSQIRRASISIPANIVEGYRRRGKADKAKFFNVAQASLEEVKYFLILSNDLDYIKENHFETLTEEVGKLLDAYMKKILSSVS